jgi:hypothetical protein
MASETVDQEKTVAPSEKAKAAEWWCNFCDFRTDDEQEYLTHSCKDVLAARGVDAKPTGANECR